MYKWVPYSSLWSSDMLYSDNRLNFTNTVQSSDADKHNKTYDLEFKKPTSVFKHSDCECRWYGVSVDESTCTDDITKYKNILHMIFIYMFKRNSRKLKKYKLYVAKCITCNKILYTSTNKHKLLRKLNKKFTEYVQLEELTLMQR